MSISILSAATGNGHKSVAQALADEFSSRCAGSVQIAWDFYESLIPSNRMMSDFYNLLQRRSKPLCRLFTELACLESKPKQNEIYLSLHDAINSYFQSDQSNTIISTTPLINRYIIRFLGEGTNRGDRRFYVVVTDPYIPMYPGFDADGADGYFCANEAIYQELAAAGIATDKIWITGYPLQSRFFQEHSSRDKQKLRMKYGILGHMPVVIVNSGSNGSYHYFRIFEQLIVQQISCHFILLCGNNKAIYTLAKQKYSNHNNVTVIAYEENMEELLSVVDLCITKPGANAVYECLVKKIPVLVDAIDGFLYQECGIVDLLKQYRFGEVATSIEELTASCRMMLQSSCVYLDNIGKMELRNGVHQIADLILGQK